MIGSQLALPGAPAQFSRAASQWMTPQDVARRLVDWAQVRSGMYVLEPSCGDGALVHAVRETGVSLIEAFEVDPELAQRAREANPDVELTVGDFLQVPGEDVFDLVVMNPPYEDGQDLEHVLHALEFAPRVVALVRLVFLAGQERGDALWSRHTLRRMAVLSTRPVFRGDGDSGAKSDFAALEITRGLANPGGVEITWWP